MSSPPDPPLGLAIVGFGGIAAAYQRALEDVAELKLAAVVDTAPEGRARAADLADVPVFASVREVLAAADEHRISAALVTSPPASHEEVCAQLLAGGLHVLCEKPLATSTNAATRMLSVAARSGRALMMASKFRYVPDVVEAQTMVRNGLIGDVVWLENSFCSPVDMSQRWNANPRLSGGGVLIDNGAHAIDVVRFFLGDIVRVFAHFGRRVQTMEVEDSVRLQLEAAAGAVVEIRLSWSVDAANDYYITVCGARGTLQVGWQASRYRLHGQREWTVFGSGYDKIEAFSRQLRDFAWTVSRDGHEPVLRPEDAIESVRVIDAAYRAARIERWIPVQGYQGEFL